MNTLARVRRSVKFCASVFSCEVCGYSFFENPTTPHDFSTGPGARKGTLVRYFRCHCSCGGIEIAANDGFGLAAVYHAEDCPADACHRRGYERYRERERARERAQLERIAPDHARDRKRAQLELSLSAKSGRGKR